jgi:desulfoferrodoxin (superoxide reductase-like protein)/very-short-patch-repair endonuclease
MKTEEFIERSKLLNGNEYDYSLTEYKNYRKKLKITCSIHGVFETTPDSHLKGHKCKLCSNDKVRKTNNDFINQSNKIHNNRYNYSLVEYENANKKVKILCNIHGIFEQKPNKHLHGEGCPICFPNKKLTQEEFIKKSNDIHNFKYDYSMIEYVNLRTNIKIICKIHGIFEQKAGQHVYGNGCPLCNTSKGEEKIINFLNKNNIEYSYQKIFDDCIDKKVLPFDFYLPEYNLCIEYDGKQHYMIIDRWGGKYGFLDRQKKDNIKNNYCLSNNINLLRISYKENILNKLSYII